MHAAFYPAMIIKKSQTIMIRTMLSLVKKANGIMVVLNGLFFKFILTFMELFIVLCWNS